MTNSADRGVLAATGPEPVRTTVYGPADHHVYEVFLPQDEPRAWVVLVHGGFWRAEWDRTHLRPLAGALPAHGYAVALVEYVRSGMPGGGWPAPGCDVVAALAAVRRDEAADLPLVVVGHSAGGHLAVWALHADGAPEVAGAVSLAGCLDLHLVDELELDGGAAADLMGGAPGDDPTTWDGADPARLGRTPYPVVVLHGDSDEQVPLAVATSWWERAGDPARDRIVVLPGVSHFPLVDPGAEAHGALLDAISSLLPPEEAGDGQDPPVP